MKTLIYIFSLLLLIQACDKSSQPTNSTNNKDKIISYTVIDKITHQPVDSALIHFAFNNILSENKYTNAHGLAFFTIQKDWVVNEVNISKKGYSLYRDSPNSADVVLDQTIQFDHVAYLRFHVENIAPATASDKIEIYYPKNLLSTSPPDIWNGAVNTTYISEAEARNISLLYTVYSATTLVNSTTITVTSIGGDTTDVNISF